MQQSGDEDAQYVHSFMSLFEEASLRDTAEGLPAHPDDFNVPVSHLTFKELCWELCEVQKK